MVPSVRSALTTCIALMVVGGEARKTRGIGPTPAAPNRHRAAMFSFAAMAVFLVLSACAEAPAPTPRAALTAQRNVSAPAPTPCNIPNTGQADTPNVLNSPDPSSRDQFRAECIWGVPPLRTTWSWSGRWEDLPEVAAARERADSDRRKWYEGLRRAEKDFQSRQRAGR
jgi:hypothetical protein